MPKHAIQFILVNMFTGGTSSLTQLCYVLLVQSIYLLWIFKGTGNYILDFCLPRIGKLTSCFRKHWNNMYAFLKAGRAGY